MNSDETQIQVFVDWLMSDAKRVTPDSRQNLEFGTRLWVNFFPKKLIPQEDSALAFLALVTLKCCLPGNFFFDFFRA